MELETHFGTRTLTEPSPLEAGTRARRMLVIADLSGRAGRGVCESGAALLERPFVHVDIDNLESVLQAFAPRIELPLGDPAVAITLEFRELDDFHPDSLRRRLPVFKAFAESRARLLDSATFQEEARRLTGSDPISSAPKEEPAEEAAEEMSGTLERLLGKRPDRAAPGVRVGGVGVDLSRLIENAVRPHVIADRSPQQDQLLNSVALAEAEQLRKILHAPEFQRLEATWRSVTRMVHAAEQNSPSILLLDVSEEELRADLARAESPERSSLFRLIVEQETGESSWSLLVGDLAFDAGASDVACLGALGRLAQEAKAPFIAAARPSLLGCEGFDRGRVDAAAWKLDAVDAARWQAFRADASACWIGLAVPRVLLRLPYGERTDEVDGPPFEEVGDRWSHADYLWGNPAFAAAALVLAAEGLELDDLPAHFHDGAMQPCAETLIGERTATKILACGPMPLMSYRDRPAVRLLRFQSLADPPSSLPGISL